MTVIAINQPYFLPYAGWFRLFAACDVFVILDDVQFNRRGYIHRNRFTMKDGNPDWMTLPLKKQDRDTTRVMDMRWAEDARKKWWKQVTRTKVALADVTSPPKKLKSIITSATEYATPLECIIESMDAVCIELGMRRQMIRSSVLRLPSHLRGQDRIIAICDKLKATTYVNSPGGVELYSANNFKDHGIDLKFLSMYKGGMGSVGERLCMERASDIKAEIMDSMEYICL